MFRTVQQAWSKLEDLIASLEVLKEDAPECLVWLVPQLATLLGADQSLAFGVRQDESRLSLAFAHSYGSGFTRSLAHRFDELLRAKKNGLLFNPARPEALQRNVAIALPPVLEIPGAGYVARRGRRCKPIHFVPGKGLLDAECRSAWVRLYADAGIDSKYVLRILICDGPVLLAWLGVFLPQRPSEQHRQLLGSLAAPLKRRLKLEALVGASLAGAGALETVLEKIAAPSFLIAAEGRIEYANSSGRAMVDVDPARVRESLRESLTPNGSDAAFDVTRLSSPGAPDHYLAVQRRSADDHASRVEKAAQRWKLKPHEARVLSSLVQGDANKTIADKLDCMECTVELHITRMLRQAEVESRAALIAKFWTTS